MNKAIDSKAKAGCSPPGGRKSIPLKFFYFLMVGGWTAVIVASALYNSSRMEDHALDSARIQARTAVEKDVVYRQWNSLHGGVFVPLVPGKFEPNPYLPEKGREVVDRDSGKVYTKINPAYMTRLVHEIGALRTGVRSHITSNKPIRKGNEPDAWESAALRQLESRQSDEVSSLELINSAEYMRLIRGLETEPSCMSCHAGQGYKIGDIRGGISVDVPMAPFLAGMRESQNTLYVTHLSIWVIGLMGISLSMRQIAGGIRERDHAESELRALTEELEERVLERTTALRANQREMLAFVENANAGVFLKDLDGRFSVANALLGSMVGLPVKEIVGHRDVDVLSPENFALLHAHEKRVIESGKSLELKSGFASRSGLRYSCFSFPVMEGDEVVALGGLIVDMSERDNAERVLREAKEAAEKASRAKSDFLANMSHEIRTPLNGVIGMADLLLRTRLSPDQASMAAAIKTSGDSLLSVLNDVLDISKIEAGKVTLEQIGFAVRDVLFDSVKGLTPIAYKKSLELILHVSPAIPEYLVGDPVRLRQVILNLVNNALKFTEKGEVVITALLVSGDEDNVRLRFSITDTGIGIPADKQQSIFQAFEQVDASTTRKYGGTGLGLAICSRLLGLMDSKLELKSHEGFGSSFWFELTLPIEKNMPLVQKPLVCSEALHGIRVLIVDDNNTNLRILNETISEWGMTVQQASSADEAYMVMELALDAGSPFQLVLTDLQMPDKDGVELLNMIKTDSGLLLTPVILLSSGNLSSDVQAGTGKGRFFASVLDKPVRPETLMRSIASALHIWESYDVQELKREEELHIDSKLGSLKVLLAEDVEMNQMVATRMLKELGHEVTVVGDGKEAVERISTESYDMVFMDIQMPVMDGVQATLVIRELEQQGMLDRKTPIVAMTANALKGDKHKYLSVGMDGYLSKPILLEELRNIITEVMHPEDADSRGIGAGREPSWCTIQGIAQDTLRFARPEPGYPLDESDTFLPEGDAGSESGKSDAKAPEAASARQGSATGEHAGESGSGHINWALLEKSFASNRDFITDSMTLYMRDAPKLLQEVFAALARSDNAQLTVNAHALKGITGYFTREGAYEDCYALEELGREALLPEKRTEAEQRLGLLRERMEQLMAEMQDFMKSEQA